MLVVCRQCHKPLAYSFSENLPLWMASLICLFPLLWWNLPLQLHHSNKHILLWLHASVQFGDFIKPVPFPWLHISTCMCYIYSIWQCKLHCLKMEIISENMTQGLLFTLGKEVLSLPPLLNCLPSKSPLIFCAILLASLQVHWWHVFVFGLVSLCRPQLATIQWLFKNLNWDVGRIHIWGPICPRGHEFDTWYWRSG